MWKAKFKYAIGLYFKWDEGLNEQGRVSLAQLGRVFLFRRLSDVVFIGGGIVVMMLVGALLTLLEKEVELSSEASLGIVYLFGLLIFAAYALWTLFCLFCSLFFICRRIHDAGFSGWWLFLIFVPVAGWIALFFMMLMPGIEGETRFGPDPKEVERDELGLLA